MDNTAAISPEMAKTVIDTSIKHGMKNCILTMRAIMGRILPLLARKYIRNWKNAG